MELHGTLDRLAGVWRRRVGTASRRALLALFVALLVGGAHVGRLGTVTARAGVAAAFGLLLALVLVRWWRERRDWKNLRRTLARVLLPTDRALGERALRALALLDRTESDPAAGSAELARLHLERQIERASPRAVQESAERRAKRWRRAALVLVTAAAIGFFVAPARVAEGLDVLAARRGVAPLPMVWLEGLRISVQPPAYLKSSDRHVTPGITSEQPQGSLLTVRGVPKRDGRRLVLTDGERETPFVSDAAGGVVARWTLAKDAKLVVAARFGQVRIDEPVGIELRAVEDRAPDVRVVGAPMKVELGDLDRLAIEYEATDDHGLREVDLVLRSGDREERRVLVRLDSDKVERGGHALSSRDPFLRRMFLPVVITVEARDNDPFGAKWGVSEPITVVPPIVGAPEAERWTALVRASDALVDLVAFQLEASKPPAEKGARSLNDQRREHIARAQNALSSAIGAAYAGLSVPRGLTAFLQGQLERLERPLRAGESAQRRTEDVLLAVDMALQNLAVRDATSVSKRLGDVAEEVAHAARQARETERRSQGISRFEAALSVLERGADALVRLGALGRDVGGVAQGDVGRIKSSRAREDLFHAELAALHLAQRLRRPNPSFGAARQGGVESGVPESGMPSGEPSQADDQFDQLAGELEELAQDHAAEIGSVERALAEAEQKVDLEGLRAEARARAEAVRRAVEGLPTIASEPGSARGAAALAREHALGMAQNLDRLELGDAVRSGQDALSTLTESERKAVEARSPADWVDDAALEQARKRLNEELAWAEKQLEQLKRAAEQQARGALGESSKREDKLAGRAGNLAGRGQQGEAALRGETVDRLERAESAMREAVRQLSEGKAEEALRAQREAQRLLEQASSGKTTDADDGGGQQQSGQGGSDGQGIRLGGEVPAADDAKAAEEFRRRVLRGLGKERSGRLAPAVQRYAEGLLR